MKRKIKKIMMNKIFDKTWKKSLIIFLVIFSIIFVGGLTSINYLNDIVANNNIHPEIVTVYDKAYGDKSLSDYYIIVGTNNKTYSIVNHDDGYGVKLFTSIEVGKTYEFIVREPELTDINQNTHILQVHDVTNPDT